MERLKPSYLVVERLDGSVEKVLLTEDLPAKVKEQLTTPHPGRALLSTAAANLQVSSRAHQLNPSNPARRADLEYSRRLANLEANWQNSRFGPADQKSRKALRQIYRKEVPYYFRRSHGELRVWERMGPWMAKYWWVLYAFSLLIIIATLADALGEAPTYTVAEAIGATIFYSLIFTWLIYLGRRKRDSMALPQASIDARELLIRQNENHWIPIEVVSPTGSRATDVHLQKWVQAADRALAPARDGMQVLHQNGFDSTHLVEEGESLIRRLVESFRDWNRNAPDPQLESIIARGDANDRSIKELYNLNKRQSKARQDAAGLVGETLVEIEQFSGEVEKTARESAVALDAQRYRSERGLG